MAAKPKRGRWVWAAVLGAALLFGGAWYWQGKSTAASTISYTTEAISKGDLTVTVTAKIGEKTMFLVEVRQAGIFQIRNIPEGDLEPVMMIGCPNILFPYAREAVSDAVTRAGFQPVLLSPVNFESLYQAQRQQATGDVPVQ